MKDLLGYIGLILLLVACGNSKSGNSPNLNIDKPTFADDIAPIIHANCTPCHSDENVAPFELITYSQIKNYGRLIKQVTQIKYMPPWPADPTYRHFVGEKVLTDDQLKAIANWVDQGMVSGDTSKVKFDPKVDLAIAEKPDMIVGFNRSYLIKGNNKDNFLVMKLPFELPNDTFIKRIEFVPGNTKAIHHMNGHLLNYEYQAKKNVLEGSRWENQETGMAMEIHKKLGLLNDDGSYPVMTPSVCNYLPGTEPVKMPASIGGYKVKRKAAFYLNDMHYGPQAIDQQDSSYFKIYFAPKAPLRPTGEFILGTLTTQGKAPTVPTLYVPANTTKLFTATWTLERDITLLNVTPHMHLIGKTFKAYAIKPNGDTIRIIHIPKWDFRWQYTYSFPSPLILPSGTKIIAEGLYDNTSSNPFNPNHPPKDIYEREGSMRTTDEMFQLICVFVPYQKGDENLVQGK